MLGKLIKYDLKAAAKLFLLIHGVYLLICIAARFIFMDRIRFTAPTNSLILSLLLLITLFSLLVSALMIVTEMQVAFRFYRNLFSKEGYLSWTLPVSAPQHLWAKIISGYILMAADLTILFGGILLLVSGDNVTTAYSTIADEVEIQFGISLRLFAVILFAACLISCLWSVIMIYFSIMIGQLFPSHRVLGAIAVYFIMNFVLQILSFILMAILGYFPGYEMYTSMQGAFMDMFVRILIVSLVLTLILTVAQYAATHYIIKKKLNLI